MALNFPNSPSLNDLHEENLTKWRWNGSSWIRVVTTTAAGAQGFQGAQGATAAAGGRVGAVVARAGLVLPDCRVDALQLGRLDQADARVFRVAEAGIGAGGDRGDGH